jgi:hypothetical protein
MKTPVLWLTLVAAVMCCSGRLTHGREWVDRSGEYREEATFVRYQDGQVWLRRPNGQYLAIRWAELSKDDQTFVTTYMAAIKEAGIDQTRLNAPDAEWTAILTAARVRTQPDGIPGEIPGGPPIQKHVYSGCRGTFHIVGNLGTALYWQGSNHWLAQLQAAGIDATGRYYLYSPRSGRSSHD